MKILLFFVFVSTYCSISFGQYTNAKLEDILATYSDEKLLIESSRLLEEGYYSAADVLYRLAKCYHRTGNVNKAEENYTAFLTQAPKKTDLTASAQLGLDKLANAKRSMEFPKKNVNVINLGNTINTTAQIGR